MLNVEFSDGSDLTCTTSHKFILCDGTRVKAEALSLGDKLQKSEWPIIDGTDAHDLDYYAQGFFSGDGWVKASTGTQYIGLYGDKRKIQHSWNEDSRNTYDVKGGYVGTNTSLTKDYLCFKKGTFQPKSYVPHEASLESKRLWLAGLADSDGCVCSSGTLQISSKDREFLLAVKALLNTMGANGNLQIMKDCWRISISGSWAATLHLPTKRLRLTPPSRDSRRFLKVTAITPMDNYPEVFCFTEPKNHSGVFNGVYTGQCGEQPLAPDSSCLLGSINLTQFVKDPFGESPVVDLNELLDAVGIAVRMLDNVNDVTNYPLDRQRKAAQNKRRIGLGVTGFADALLMMKHRYGSDQAVQFVHDIFERITERAYLESTQLAAEKGPFPLYSVAYTESNFIKTLPSRIIEDVERDGIRNSHLTSIAPTGTISLLAGNVSSGIEPIFATSYTRKVLQPDGSHREEEVVDYAVKLYREMFGDDAELPDYFVTTADLKPEDHVRMQAAAQKYVDSAISKTINCPEDISFDDFKDVYRLAYELGCKGCTTYRPNDVTGSVLSVKEDKKPAAPVEPVASDVLRDRPAALQGQTYKLRFPSTDAAFYVTINDDDEGNPFEMFVNTKDPSHQAWVVALTRMVSAVFRRGGDVRFVAEELQAVFDPNGGAWIGGKYVPSIPAAIGAILGEHLGRSAPVLEDLPAKEEVKHGAAVQVCPKCFGTEFKKEAGCETCLSCGHSKCG